MTPQSTSNPNSIDNFTTSQQLEFFKELKEKRFSGEVVFADRLNTAWIFYFYLGRIIYSTGGEHPVRRWRRNLAYYFPQIVANLKSELESLQNFAAQKTVISWDYYLLCLWVEQQKVDREQATKMIRAVTVEVLFDITYARDITYVLKPQDKALTKQLAMIDCEPQIIEAWKLWEQWQDTKFARYSPNLAPKLKQSEALTKKLNSSETIYKALAKMLQGKYTFRDLAVQKQTSLLLVARSLTPYFRFGAIELVQIRDLPGSLPDFVLDSSATTVDETFSRIVGSNFSQSASSNSSKLTVACVDSNSVVCQILKKMVTSAGYQYVSDSGTLNTSKLLKTAQPDLVFINVELAEFSGYELCSLLRQIDNFARIPIVLYGKKIGLGDRVKAKMAGCTELITESLEVNLIRNTIAKYIKAS
ncbi:response regulator [Myxosarcina sp. GI1]|uniref:response regulator n=1 Tax=Myxosarcina sp. GI1 TaxID=1541065 RepID=UPI0005633664|nr:response regulator [Myxosarcina sp. GI1]